MESNFVFIDTNFNASRYQTPGSQPSSLPAEMHYLSSTAAQKPATTSDAR